MRQHSVHRCGGMIVELPKGTVVALFICKQSVASVHQSGSEITGLDGYA